jgi:hypothetical protein
MAAKLTWQRNGAGAGWAAGGVAASLLIGILIEPFRRTVGLENVTIVYLSTVVLTAAFGGHAAGLFTAVAAALSYDFFLTTPYHSLVIDSPAQVITVGLLLATGLAAGLAGRARWHLTVAVDEQADRSAQHHRAGRRERGERRPGRRRAHSPASGRSPRGDPAKRPSRYEVVALKVGRLDLLRATLRVAEAAPEVAGRLEWGTVKTHEARTVHLPKFLRDELAAHLAGRPHRSEALVFTAARGGPLRESKWVPGYFKPAVRAAGLPEALRWYDLRHTAVSLLIREGASIKAVQKQMGHATAAQTLDTYGHLFADELPDLAERLEALRARAIAPPARPSSAPVVVGMVKGAGQRPG